ncbi:(S)-2,3-di-O-geranylgeranylglyceryl phosphate synthase [Methanocaldococcus villosus KIN24-T80]|uniref:Digeranylgeranylglyceryl phosphate synthase n=1 Tax=Methanocaldococcus villosus KIN24-T80 TaxID=1069083 RepID=N6VT77_9EURY|nr:UbiA family prenyltransferase [Methanocaldococcus villosus]ENN96401.1 (S)-2,3-di-O-geranylgeranylglyceryl phosphate synthase [Methanocaldococcus villosus KIN24-T80]
MKAFIELIRMKNCISAGIGGVIGYLLSCNFCFDYKAILIFLTIFFICGYGNVINDIYDIEIDKINKPYRPLPSGRVKIFEAKMLSFSFLIIGIVLSIFINILAFIIAVINSSLLYLYAKTFKKIKIFGNIIVAYLTGSVFLFGAAAGKEVLVAIILFICSFLATWAREIIKDFEDIKGDELKGVVSLPIKYGKISLYFSGFLLILAIVFSFIPYILNIFNIYYLILISACDFLFLISIVKLLRHQNAKEVSKEIKIIMNLVLLAFIISSLIR